MGDAEDPGTGAHLLKPWCPHCGDMLPEGAALTRCPRCGLPLTAGRTGRNRAPRGDAKMVAAMLSLLLLGLGGSIYLYSTEVTKRQAPSVTGASSEAATVTHALEAPAEGAGAPSNPPAPSAARAAGTASAAPAPRHAGDDPGAGGAAIPSRLRITALTASGQLREPVIRAALEEQRPAIEACHRPSEPLERGGRSVVPARWVIDRTGKVSNVMLRGGGLTSSGNACLTAALEGLELPAPASGVVTVNASLELVAR